MSSKKKKKSAGSVKGMAVDTWEKLEQVFESRVARVLNAMQIPSHDDVQQLASRVEALTRVVEKLAGRPIPAAKKRATRKASKKTSKKASKKPASAKKSSPAKSTKKKSSKRRTSTRKKTTAGK
ncbi:MAG: hypothetical protein HKN59_06910 [Gammaproteobacteria bacterium]|nr:hypothetical protein [Gammaproteobacteria bacterium]